MVRVNYKTLFTVTVTLIIRNPLKSDFKQFFIDDMASSTVSPEISVVAIVGAECNIGNIF